MRTQLEKDPNFSQILNHKMIGKNITQCVTGLEVNAIVKRVFEDKYSIFLETEHEEVQWGDNKFTKGSVSMRKFDGWIIGEPKINGIKLTKEDFIN